MRQLNYLFIFVESYYIDVYYESLNLNITHFAIQFM